MWARFSIAIVAALLLASCGAPPSEEMDRAQGAIDAARAAGAEQYATEEFHAAVESLKQSQDAVQQRDYRSALSLAVDSLERAQNAAKQAADQRAAIQSEVARALADMNVMLERGDQRLAVSESARVARRTIVHVRTVLTEAKSAVQKAGATANSGDYQNARRELEAARQQTAGAIEEIDRAIAARPARPRREAGAP